MSYEPRGFGSELRPSLADPDHDPAVDGVVLLSLGAHGVEATARADSSRCRPVDPCGDSTVSFVQSAGYLPRFSVEPPSLGVSPIQSGQPRARLWTTTFSPSPFGAEHNDVA